ncbi:UNVERIFIED_CONTAM: hypothetical protein RMT77_008313 [Armadillidium vulgare]
MISKFTLKFCRNQLYIFLSISVLVFLPFYINRTIVLTSHKRLSPEKMENPTKPDCKIPPLETVDDFFQYGKKEKYNCKNLKRIGRNGDGSKYICLDKPFEIVPNNCVVLSFGINNEWSFDNAISNLGCTVYSFDPTMGKEDFDLTPNIHFYNLGISNFKREMEINSKLGKVDRYENILSMLNLIDKKIDYLKMDVEGSEIDFLEDVLNNSIHLLENVKQIGMEIHPLTPPEKDDEETMKTSRFYKLWRYMHQLECNGFELLRFDPNLVSVNVYTFKNRIESQCYEVVWVKK